MALHTELPIYRTGVRLLDLAVKAQVQMPRTVKRALGEKITQHCVEILDLMALANASQRDTQHKYSGKEGTITQAMDDNRWMVSFKGRNGGMCAFDAADLTVAEVPA